MIRPPEHEKIIPAGKNKVLLAHLGEIAMAEERIAQAEREHATARLALREDFGEFRGLWQRFQGTARVIRLFGDKEGSYIYHECEVAPGYYQLDGWQTIRDRTRDFDVAWLKPQQTVESIVAYGVPFPELREASLAEIRQAERSAVH